MSFSQIIKENDYFSIKYSPSIKSDGTLFAIRAKLKLFPMVNSFFSAADHVLSKEDFISKCIRFNLLEIHMANELSAIIKDACNLKNIIGLQWLVIEMPPNYFTNDNCFFLHKLANELECYGVGLSLLVKGKIEAREFFDFSQYAFSFQSYSYLIEKSDETDLFDMFSLLCLSKQRGVIYLSCDVLHNANIDLMISKAKSLNIDIVVYGVDSEYKFTHLKSESELYVEGDFVSEPVNSITIKKRTSAFSIKNENICDDFFYCFF
nr:hypothetical protein [uncultured Tolumonas sp.]